MLTLLAFALLLASAALINSLFRHSLRASYLGGLFLIAYASLVVIAELASLVRQINAPFYLLAELILIVLSWLLWQRAGKPALLGPFSSGRWAFWRELPPFRSAPALYILAAGVGLAYLLGAYLILAFPQHNYDSMTYHLSRVGYWLQHQTLAPWPTPNPRQTTFPINAELGLLWTILLWGSDQLTGFVQWFSALATMLSIYGLARLLGATRPQGFFAALVWATFPQVLLQSITTQNDLLVAAFISSAVYFFYLGMRQEQKGPLLLSGLALGLAVGTKTTTIIFLPSLAFAVLISVWRRRKTGISLVMIWIVAAIAGTGLLGAFNYVQNTLYYGDPFGVPEWTVNVTSPRVSRWALLANNSLIYLYQFFDPSGLPDVLGGTLIEGKARLVRAAIEALNLPIAHLLPGNYYSLRKALYPLLLIHPDTTWFGPLSALLLIPAIAYHLWQGLSSRDELRLGLILIGAGFGFTLSLLMGWSPYRGRYLVPCLSLLAPTLIFWYRASRLSKFLQWAITISAVWIMGATILNNVYLPLSGENAVWRRSQADIRALSYPKIKPVMEMVETRVPAQAALVTRLGVDDWDYPLFGAAFERKVIQADSAEKEIDLSAFQKEGADYLLISPRERPFLQVPQGFEFLDETAGWTLYRIAPGSTSSNIPGVIREKLLGITDSRNLVKVDPSLAGVVGVIDIVEFDWGIESHQGQGFLWLGEGTAQGFSAFLWSEKETAVRVVFQVLPGPSREDTLRNLEFRYLRRGRFSPIRVGSVVRRYQIAGLEAIEVSVTLQRGLNQMDLIALDEATIRRLPNGDERPLLVMLQHVDILPIE